MSDSDDDVPIGAQRLSAGAGKSDADAKSGDAAAVAKELIPVLEPAKGNAAAHTPESSDSDDEPIGEKFARKKTGERGLLLW